MYIYNNTNHLSNRADVLIIGYTIHRNIQHYRYHIVNPEWEKKKRFNIE